MELTGRALWQVGAGDNDRKYDDICLKFDVMIVGPGDLGRYQREMYQDCDDVRRFCEDARRGDVVLLRLGNCTVIAVGEVADDSPDWSEAFADVDGWDLQHVRRVRWIPDARKTFPQGAFGGQVRSFAAVISEQIKAWVESIEVKDADHVRGLAPLPQPGAPLGGAELGERLFIRGLSDDCIGRLMKTWPSLHRLASLYLSECRAQGKRPSEAETVCYLVVPFLLSLGWSERTAAIEWVNIDVALFRETPRVDSALACVVEAKQFDSSVFSAVEQALGYALRGGREGCDRLIVTDGARYALHRRNGDEFKLEAYLNILKMRDSYAIHGCAGAVEAVLGMAR